VNTRNTILAKLCVFVSLAIFSLTSQAQNKTEPTLDSPIAEANDTSLSLDTIQALELVPAENNATLLLSTADSLPRSHKRDWDTWRPSPKRALWLALVLPGAGQIYNRKYWKLPIIYGGFVGCAYAMRWNNMMYRDYSQAYLDIMDDDPNTQSYNQFLHLGNQITSENMARWQEIFRKRKDRYRRWRDLSFFVMVGVYALSVVDAYVDASLSEFDISPDLSMKVSPAVINSNMERNPFKSSAIGLQCSLNF
jgi:hypothetical protein